MNNAVNSQRRSKNLAVMALMMALTIFFCFQPIPIPGGVTLAFMILPLLIVAQGYDFKMTISLAVLMATINQIAWYTTKAAGVLAFVWQNPLVCMVPRILIGVVSYFMGYGLRKLLLHPRYVVDENGEKRMQNATEIYAKDGLISAVSTAVGVVVNTLFCGLFTLMLYNGRVLSTGTAISIEYILTWFGINFVIEVIAFTVIVPPIILALRKARLVPQPTMGKEVIIAPNNSVVAPFDEGNSAESKENNTTASEKEAESNDNNATVSEKENDTK